MHSVIAVRNFGGKVSWATRVAKARYQPEFRPASSLSGKLSRVKGRRVGQPNSELSASADALAKRAILLTAERMHRRDKTEAHRTGVRTYFTMFF
ncbi:hypothetical protein ABIC08_008280 [Bradyrhizobium sp. RT9b]|uniref:hypothetical protein n=1 Tax=unclassified Bradyrhizobium TaxID=2631580 RepID=UPI0033929A04